MRAEAEAGAGLEARAEASVESGVRQGHKKDYRCNKSIHRASVTTGRVGVGPKTRTVSVAVRFAVAVTDIEAGAVTDRGAGTGAEAGAGARTGSGAKTEKKVQGRDHSISPKHGEGQNH